jgi:hypothetical protein
MSLIKWTLALAGAALGVRHMSDRHRRRMSGSDDAPDTAMPDDLADLSDPSAMRPPRTDRDSPLSGLSSSGAMPGTGGSTGLGLAGGMGSGSGAGRTDDLLSPDSDDAPGTPGGRL